jgi:hypothetical protein
MSRLTRTLALIALAPILFTWATVLNAFVIVGVTSRGIAKVWHQPTRHDGA